MEVEEKSEQVEVSALKYSIRKMMFRKKTRWRARVEGVIVSRDGRGKEGEQRRGVEGKASESRGLLWERKRTLVSTNHHRCRFRCKLR